MTTTNDDHDDLRAAVERLAAEVDDYLDPHPTLWEDA